MVGALRDLRGVAQACANKRAYAMLFEALYPTHLTVIARCAEVFARLFGVVLRDSGLSRTF